MSAVEPMIRSWTFVSPCSDHWRSMSRKKLLTSSMGGSQCLDEVLLAQARQQSPALGNLQTLGANLLSGPFAADVFIEHILHCLPVGLSGLECVQNLTEARLRFDVPLLERPRQRP